jgi:hypothetical protein
MKTTIGIALGVSLGGCSSQPPGPHLGSEPTAGSVQEEVALNAEASEKLRLISRLYVGGYAALEWYQPVAGVIGFAVVQPGGYELIDNESLRGLKPTQVFKTFAGSLEVPQALARLEANPEVLQELQAREVLEAFVPEADLPASSLALQSSFQVSQGNAAFNCSFTNFQNALCLDSAWDLTRCSFDRVAYLDQRANLVEESQTAVCSMVGSNQMYVGIDGCVTFFGSPEGANRCSGGHISNTGSWLSVSQGFLRSWHGFAQTYGPIDDAYNHIGAGRPQSIGGRFNFATRGIFD